jgi:hypothetical protein
MRPLARTEAARRSGGYIRTSVNESSGSVYDIVKVMETKGLHDCSADMYVSRLRGEPLSENTSRMSLGDGGAVRAALARVSSTLEKSRRLYDGDVRTLTLAESTD